MKKDKVILNLINYLFFYFLLILNLKVNITVIMFILRCLKNNFGNI